VRDRHELSLFAGPTSAALTLVAYQTFGSSALANYSFTIGPLRYVAVCRTSYSLDRDDVGVDVIRGTCRDTTSPERTSTRTCNP